MREENNFCYFVSSISIEVVVFGLFTYQRHQKQEKLNKNVEKYEKYDYYTGIWEIDSYKFLEDGKELVQFIGSH